VSWFSQPPVTQAVGPHIQLNDEFPFNNTEQSLMNEFDQDLIDDEIVKEVYAHFGLAYYNSECLHRELGNIYTILTFKSSSDITTSRAEEKMAYAYSLTLGKVLDELKDLFSEDLYQRLANGVEKRNFLAHHFWYERNYLMFSKTGLLQMIEELSELSNLFSGLDKELQIHFRSKWEEFGLTEEVFNETAQQTRGDALEPLPKNRKLQKVEEIIAVWDVPFDDKRLALVFQTNDDCLLELCDIGLGWSRFASIESNWTINEKLKSHLPIKLNPRPKNVEAWNYEFDLGKGTVLWVKKSEKIKSFHWGVRVETK
jgi:hypothetical protein